MAQLPFVEPQDAEPLTAKVYADAEQRFQMVLNIFKITGHAPEIAEKMWQIFFDILQDGQVDWATKELLILKATTMGGCLYCVTQHEIVAGRLGAPANRVVIAGWHRFRIAGQVSLPAALIFHLGPGGCRRQPLPALQQFDGNAIGILDEGHVAVSRWPKDVHTHVHQVLA
jgi:AhpD family alkylhydroperoxidase